MSAVVPGREYEGKRVVVTGAASGIGEQLADVLMARGAVVVGLDRDEIALPLAERHRVDLADSDSIARTVDAVGGPVDALFNVAGVSGPIGGAVVIGINFVGTRELTAGFLPLMGEGGAIAVTSSLAGSQYLERRELAAELIATPDRESAMRWCEEHLEEIGTGYAVSKDALIWFTLENAPELATRGIRLNCIAPGTTLTPIIEDTVRARGDEFLKRIPMPLGRLAEPREQAEVLAFMNSPAASYLSGQVLWVDGGYHAGLATGRFESVTGSVGPPTPTPVKDAD